MNFQQHMPALDGVRGFAILVVVIYHYFGGTLASSNPAEWAQVTAAVLHLGATGVDLFFVLSGFLLGGILIDAKGSSRFFSAFFLRRFCRILPLYFLFLLLVWLASVWLPVLNQSPLIPRFLEQPAPMPWYSYLGFFQNFHMAQTGSLGPDSLSVTWSLAVEEQFYLLLPLVIWLCPKKWLAMVLIAGVGFAIVARLLFVEQLEHGYVAAYVSLPGRLDSFCIGVLVALWWRSAAWQRLQVGWLWAGLVAAATGWWFCYNQPQLYYSFGFSLVAMTYASVLMLALCSGSPLQGLMTLGVLQRCGRLAFGLYLLHMPVLWVCHIVLLKSKPMLNSWSALLVTLVALLLCWLVAEASWRWYEKPWLALGRRLSY